MLDFPEEHCWIFGNFGVILGASVGASILAQSIDLWLKFSYGKVNDTSIYDLFYAPFRIPSLPNHTIIPQSKNNLG